MTKYTAEDYARAEFARHVDGRIAARMDPVDTDAWCAQLGNTWVWCTDAEMAAASGWSIVRDAESLTAREHLELAWDAAIVPEDGTIPAGAAHISRWGDGNDFAYLRGRMGEREAVDANVERRLLDPPSPARPEGAEEWEDWLIETMPHESMPDEDIALLADRIAARAVTNPEEKR